MTLVQVLTSELQVHMSCDFRLTYPITQSVADSSAHKLVHVARPRFSAFVGVTGLGYLEAKLIGRWIAETVDALAMDASHDQLLDALRGAEKSLLLVRDRRWRRHTFVIGAMVGSQAVVSFVSNFQHLDQGRTHTDPIADDRLEISSARSKRPRLILAGATDAVSPTDIQRLEGLLRSQQPDPAVQEELQRVNAAASRRTPTISEGCNTASLHATGHGSSRPFLTPDQPGEFIPPDVQLMMEKMGLRINPKIRPDGTAEPIRVIGTSMLSAHPSPGYFREQLKLRPEDPELWNNYGAGLSGTRKTDAAITAYERALELNPTYPTALGNMARSLWLDRGDIKGAHIHFERAMHSPDGSPASAVLSDYAEFTEEALGDRATAFDLHERAVAASGTSDARSLARQAFFVGVRVGDRARADDLFDEAMTKSPQDVKVLLLSARYQWLVHENYQGARAILESAATLAPNDREVLLHYAGALLKCHESAAAAYHYQRFIKRGGDKQLVEADLGLALLDVGKVEGAVRHLRRAVKYETNRQAAHANLAAALYVVGEREASRQGVIALFDEELPPYVELELIAMRMIMESPGIKQQDLDRLEELTRDRVRGDGTTLRAMTRHDNDARLREIGAVLASVVEGDRAVSELYRWR
jgi:Flp pilus assembly protein TadD